MTSLGLKVSDGGYMHGPEWNGVIKGYQATGVKTGCDVVPQSPLAMGVTVNSGTISADSTEVSVSEQDVSLDAAGTFDRYDSIHIDNTGTATKTTGTEAPDTDKPPAAPQIPEDDTLVAVVHVEGGASQIEAGNIRDSRVFLQNAAGNDQAIQFNENGALGATDEYQWTGDEVRLTKSSDDATGHGFAGRKSRGTLASPTGVQTFDVLSEFAGYGWSDESSSYQKAGRATFQAGGNWDGAETTPNGLHVFELLTEGTLETRARVTQDAHEFWASNAANFGNFKAMEVRSDNLNSDDAAMRVFIATDGSGGGALQDVTVGASDSGGTGFRVLRVPN